MLQERLFGIDQGQPTMNTFPSKKQHGSGSGRKLKKKRPTFYDSDSSDEKEMEGDRDSDGIDSDEDMINESDNEGEIFQCEGILKVTWKSLSPPVAEDDIIGKWYAVLWADKRSCNVYVGKVLCRFLEDKYGQISNIQMHCLKLKVGSGTILEDTAAHRPDIQMFAD